MKKSYGYNVNGNMVAWNLRFQFEEGVEDILIKGSFKLEGTEGDFSFDQTICSFLHGLSQKIGDKASSKTSEKERREAVLEEYQGLQGRETWNKTERGSRETLEELQETLEKIETEMKSDIIKDNPIILEAMRKQWKAVNSKIKKKKKEEEKEVKTKKKKK
jgi:hypothetical protein